MSNTNSEVRVDKNGKAVTRWVRHEVPKQSVMQRLLNPPPKGSLSDDPSERFEALRGNDQRYEALAILIENGNTEFEDTRSTESDYELATRILATADFADEGELDFEDKAPVINWASDVIKREDGMRFDIEYEKNSPAAAANYRSEFGAPAYERDRQQRADAEWEKSNIDRERQADRIQYGD